jgi:hypothetical protein
VDGVNSIFLAQPEEANFSDYESKPIRNQDAEEIERRRL